MDKKYTYAVNLGVQVEDPNDIVKVTEIVQRVLAGLAMEGFSTQIMVVRIEND